MTKLFITISHIKDYLKCPMMAFYRHTARRGLPPHSPALSFGTVFHKMMEFKLKHEPVPWDDLRNQCHPLARADFDNMREIMEPWEPPAEWIKISVEEPLISSLGLMGRLDAIIHEKGVPGVWSGQWKTASGNRQVADLIEEVRVGFHETGYERMLSEKNYLVNGTLLGVYRKLPKHKRVKGKLVEVPLEERRKLSWLMIKLPRSNEDMLARLRDLTRLRDEITKGTRSSIRNTDACFGLYGNSRCEYYDVCHNGFDIDAPPFVDLPTRYDDVQP